MSKTLVSPWLPLVFLLLGACSSQPDLVPPDLVNCKPSNVSQACHYPADWIPLAAPTGQMRVLYEDQRVIVFVNRAKFIGVNAGLPFTQPNDADILRMIEMIEIARSGEFAVYDKLQKSCVTSVGVVHYYVNHGTSPEDLAEEGATGLYLPDCTPILLSVWVS